MHEITCMRSVGHILKNKRQLAGDRPTADRDDDDDDGWRRVSGVRLHLCVENSPEEAVTTHLDSTLARLEN